MTRVLATRKHANKGLAGRTAFSLVVLTGAAASMSSTSYDDDDSMSDSDAVPAQPTQPALPPYAVSDALALQKEDAAMGETLNTLKRAGDMWLLTHANSAALGQQQVVQTVSVPSVVVSAQQSVPVQQIVGQAPLVAQIGNQLIQQSTAQVGVSVSTPAAEIVAEAAKPAVAQPVAQPVAKPVAQPVTSVQTVSPVTSVQTVAPVQAQVVTAAAPAVAVQPVAVSAAPVQAAVSYFVQQPVVQQQVVQQPVVHHQVVQQPFVQQQVVQQAPVQFVQSWNQGGWNQGGWNQGGNFNALLQARIWKDLQGSNVKTPMLDALQMMRLGGGMGGGMSNDGWYGYLAFAEAEKQVQDYRKELSANHNAHIQRLRAAGW